MQFKGLFFFKNKQKQKLSNLKLWLGTRIYFSCSISSSVVKVCKIVLLFRRYSTWCPPGENRSWRLLLSHLRAATVQSATHRGRDPSTVAQLFFHWLNKMHSTKEIHSCQVLTNERKSDKSECIKSQEITVHLSISYTRLSLRLAGGWCWSQKITVK